MVDAVAQMIAVIADREAAVIQSSGLFFYCVFAEIITMVVETVLEDYLVPAMVAVETVAASLSSYYCFPAVEEIPAFKFKFGTAV